VTSTLRRLAADKRRSQARTRLLVAVRRAEHQTEDMEPGQSKARSVLDLKTGQG
jgi:hypothetical protein